MKTDKERKEPAEPFSLPSETGDPLPDDDEELRENERFRQGILEAWETYCADDLKPERPLDLSFLPEEVAAMLREEEPEQSRELPTKKTEKNPETDLYTKTETCAQREVQPPVRRFRQWAAAILLCAVLTGGMTWWMNNSQYAYAARFYLEKIMYQLSGNCFVSDPEEDGKKDLIRIRMKDSADLESASRFMPELLTPAYLPVGWKLKNLELSKTFQGDKQAVFTYTGPESGILSIDENYPADGDTAQAGETTDSHIIQLGSHGITLYHDSVSDNLAAEFVENRVQVRIVGNLSEEDLLRIAEKMEQGKSRE